VVVGNTQRHDLVRTRSEISPDTVIDQAATAAGLNAPVPTNIVSVDTNLRKKVIYLGDQGGFVAKALAATLPIGSDADYDILVIGDADKLGDTALTAAD